MSGRPTKFFKNPPLTPEEIRELSEFKDRCNKKDIEEVKEKTKKFTYLSKSAKENKKVMCEEIKTMIQVPPRPEYPNRKSGPDNYTVAGVKENCLEATRSAGVSSVDSAECENKLKAYETVFKLINPNEDFCKKGDKRSVCNESVADESDLPAATAAAGGVDTSAPSLAPYGEDVPVSGATGSQFSSDGKEDDVSPAVGTAAPLSDLEYASNPSSKSATAGTRGTPAAGAAVPVSAAEVTTSPPAAGDVNWIKLRVRKTAEEAEEYPEDEEPSKIKQLIYPSTEYPTIESALNKAITLLRRGEATFVDSTEDRVRKVLLSISAYPANVNEAKFKQLKDIVQTPYSNVASILSSQQWTLQNIEKLSENSKQQFSQLVQAVSDEPSDILAKIKMMIASEEAIPEDVQGVRTTELFKPFPTEIYTEDLEEKSDFSADEIEQYKDAINRNDPSVIVSVGTVQEEYDDNFMKMTIEPDGNCMFYCLAGHLNAIHYGGRTNWTQCMVRRFIRKYMERSEFTNELYQELFFGMSKEEYRRHLAEGCEVTDQSITYGTALDALAFSMATGITVCIVSDYLKNTDGSDGNVLIYHDTRPDEVYKVAFTLEYDPAHLMPMHTYQPLYMKQKGAHYDLLIRKRNATEYLSGEFVRSLHTKYYPETTHPYIPFPFMTLEYFYREISRKRNKFMEGLLRLQLLSGGSPVAGSPVAGSPLAGSPSVGSPSVGSPFAPSVGGSPIAPRPSFPSSLFRQEKPISIEETHAKTVKVPSAPQGMFRVGDYQQTLDRILRCI